MSTRAQELEAGELALDYGIGTERYRIVERDGWWHVVCLAEIDDEREWWDKVDSRQATRADCVAQLGRRLIERDLAFRTRMLLHPRTPREREWRDETAGE